MRRRCTIFFSPRESGCGVEKMGDKNELGFLMHWGVKEELWKFGCKEKKGGEERNGPSWGARIANLKME